MASPFKIPKRKLSSDVVSDSVLMQSPLSRLQDDSEASQNNWVNTKRSKTNREHSGNGLSPRVDRPCLSLKPLFRDTVKSLLKINPPIRGSDNAHQPEGNKRIGQSCSGTPKQQTAKAPESTHIGLTNGWRPKRASDKLFPAVSPPQKKSDSADQSDSVLLIRTSSVECLDSGDHPGRGRPSSPPPSDGGVMWMSTCSKKASTGPDRGLEDNSQSGEASAKHNGGSSSSSSSSSPDVAGQTSDQDSASPPPRRTTATAANGAPPPVDARKHSFSPPPSSSSSSSSPTSVLMSLIGPRKSVPSLCRKSWLNARRARETEEREIERKRERRASCRPLSLHPRPRRDKPSVSEPIVLSSEEEEGEEEAGEGLKKMSESGGVHHTPGDQTQTDRSSLVQSRSEPGGASGSSVSDQTLSTIMDLNFTAVHVGMARTESNGAMTITERSITLPLKEGDEEFVLVVMASEVRGHGVWGGSPPSLLFLWLTDSQAKLLERQLSIVHPVAQPDFSCPFLLISLSCRLSELQAALLSSILDMEEYRLARSSSSSSSSAASSSSSSSSSSLERSHALLLLEKLASPLDKHLLSLLGDAQERTNQRQSSIRTRKSDLHSDRVQGLPNRLIQYPAAPCKGRITVTTEDLLCLEQGEFLNDVIIDFYLKYLLLEKADPGVSERCHVFSSFFYKQLSRRRAAGEDNAPAILSRDVRHQRVKTWTRNVDIFTKDFLFVPVNQEAHWYLVVICFPGLEEAQSQDWPGPVGAHQSGGTPQSAFTLRSHSAPDCTEKGCQKDRVLKRPCILVMDSLKLSYHENVCRLLRDYLHVEWQVRIGTPRLFTVDTMRNTNCRVPLQDNSSDCGLYLLQYVESFLQNPVVHFDLPLRLEHWFPRQRVRGKREEIRRLVLQMHQDQNQNQNGPNP